MGMSTRSFFCSPRSCSTLCTTSEPYALSPLVTLTQAHWGIAVTCRRASSEAG
jgi:hypothetical protein